MMDKDLLTQAPAVTLNRRAAMVGLTAVGVAAVTYRWVRSEALAQGPQKAAGLAPAARPIVLTDVKELKSVTLAQVPIGGGGFVTGLDISSDGGRFVCRTDVANAYVRDSGDTAWRALFSPSTMQQRDYDPLPALNGKADGQGVAAIRIAPSNRDLIVASYHGYIWISEDGGRSIRRSGLAQRAMPSNAGVQRLFNRTLDIHPRDARQMLVGTVGDGAWFTVDGGTHWVRAELPEVGKAHDGHPGLHLVAFDKVDPRRVCIFVTGVGLFQSVDGLAGKFRLLPGGPTHCSNIVSGPNGIIYLCEHSGNYTGKVWRHLPQGGWKSSRPEHEAMVLAVDPKLPERVLVSNPNGYFMLSTDGGETWTSSGGPRWSSDTGEVAWTRKLKTMFPSEILIDAQQSSRIWVAQGVGVAAMDVATTPFSLSDWSAGIEELCAVSSLVVPGGSTFLSAWDKSFWKIESRTHYANDHLYPLVAGAKHDSSLVAYGSFMDYAADDPNFVAAIIAQTDLSAPGFTIDGGKSWVAFPSTPSSGWGQGGCIAVNGKNDIVLLPSNNGTGVYTRDCGKSWSPIMLDGQNPTSGFANAYYVIRKNVSADKTRPGTFALVYTVIQGDGYDNPLGGLWVTRDGGRSWQRTRKGVIGPGSGDGRRVREQGLEERQFWQCALEYVPGRSGELVYTPHADYAADRFYWSQDDGSTWQELHSSIRNVRSFGFGKNVAGQQRPSMFFWGEVRGVSGLWVSFDWFASPPILVTRFPSQMLAKVATVSGDPNKIGRAYVATSCAGWVQVDAEPR